MEYRKLTFVVSIINVAVFILLDAKLLNLLLKKVIMCTSDPSFPQGNGCFPLLPVSPLHCIPQVVHFT
jgi:hypothetical protein